MPKRESQLNNSERELDISYPTAWSMLHKIRKAIGNNQQRELFIGILEMDETYIGGKPRKNKEHNEDNKPKRERITNKIFVVGVVEQKSVKVQAKVMIPNSKG